MKLEGILNPVCLSAAGKSYTGFDGVVTGWGTTKVSDCFYVIGSSVKGSAEAQLSSVFKLQTSI